MTRIINLSLIQMSCSEDLKENFDKAIRFIEQAASQGANIVCTQELFKSRYFPQVMDRKNFNLAEEINDDTATMKKLTALARDYQIVLIASLFEKRVSGLYHNTAVVIDADGRFLGKYRKMHIPEDPGYIEKFYFTPGDLGYRVFRTRYADIGVLICWDQWFPEAARLIALKGGEIIIYPTAIGYYPPGKEADSSSSNRETWQIVQQGHAAANACFVAAINRVGFEETPGGGPGIDFWGGSFVANPDGQVVAQASKNEDEILEQSIDLDFIDEIRSRASYPFRDRRVDSYQDLTKMYSD